MASIAKVDKVTTLSSQERHGLVVRLRRNAVVVGLTDTDFRILDSALGAINMPAPGSNPLDHPNLVLTERNPTVSNDPGVVNVELIYEHRPSDGQNLDLIDGVFLGNMSTSINQVETNLDIDGDPIVLQYTYDANDPATDYAGKTRTQGGTIGIFKPQKTWVGRGIKSINNPQSLQDSMLLKINKVIFLGGQEETWLCTAANYSPFRPFKSGSNQVPQWMWDFEFQFDPDGWNPSVAFIHEDTGVIPGNLSIGLGIQNIDSYKQADFEDLLEMRITY